MPSNLSGMRGNNKPEQNRRDPESRPEHGEVIFGNVTISAAAECHEKFGGIVETEIKRWKKTTKVFLKN